MRYLTHRIQNAVRPTPTTGAALSSTIHSHKANLLSDRYLYPACSSRQKSLIQILKFCERPCIVPHEVMRLNVVILGSLRRNSSFGASCSENECAGCPHLSSFGPTYTVRYPSLRCFGSNGSFFFISVQAMIRSFAANFTRILVPIPFSRSRPLILFV